MLLRQAQAFIANAPDGGLKYQKKSGKTYYYRQEKDPKTNRWSKKYIKKKDMYLAEFLAQKGYLISVSSVLKKQLNLLLKLINDYDEEGISKIYRELPKERRNLVKPIAIGAKEKIEAWHREEYEPNTPFPEHLIYETEQGEYVRSKSELIIANTLYQYRNEIEYKYERPLELKTREENTIIVHPDFTIIDKHTGKIYFYEHAGRMDEPKYAVDFVKKMNLYSYNNILQGNELLITYETYSMPLDVNCVKKIVQSILERD